MEDIRQKTKFAEQHGLFRAAAAKDLFTLNCSHRNFNGDSLSKVSHVDFFVSHSWQCPSWIKRLTLCHCLNLNLSITSSVVTWGLAVVILLLEAGSIEDVRQRPPALRFSLVYGLPVAVFFATYLFGHLWDSRTFWLDQLCVDQTNSEMKSHTLGAIPAFVAQSNQMLALWDDTYFQRLWCNYELAVRAKVSATAHAIQLVPTWMPLWALSSFVFLCIYCFAQYGQAYSIPLDLDSRMSLAVSMWNAMLPSVVAVALCGMLPLSWICFHKLRLHKLMLEQMDNFDLRNAECSMESDREIIQEQVLDLFDEALEPPLHVAFGAEDDLADAPLMSPVSPETIRGIRHITSYPHPEEVIDQFNAYVRGPLRESVEASVGNEEHIALTSCIAANLPILLSGSVCVLDCDGRDCQQQKKTVHYCFEGK